MAKKKNNKTEENKENSTNKLQKKEKKSHKFVKKIVFLLIFFAILTSIAQYVMFYYALPLLKTSICDKISQKSQNLYSINFDSLKINILTRSITLHNFTLSPDTAVYINLVKDKNYNKAIYNINIAELEIKNIKLSSIFGSKTLKIKELTFNQPIVRLVNKPNAKRGIKYDAIHNDLYPMLKNFFEEIVVNKINIIKGYFDFYLKITDEKQKAVVGKINIVLENMNINQKTYDEKNKLFYSEKIFLQSHDYEISLGDSIHSILASELIVNSFDSTIYAKDVKLKNTKKISLKQYEKKDIFNIKLNKIDINGIDINKAYFQKKVDIKNVLILNPDIKFSKGKSTKNNATTHSRGNWNQLIKGTLANIKIDSFKVEKAKLKISNPAKFTNPAYEIEKIDMVLTNFLLDSTVETNKNKIFYSEAIDINLKNLRMRLPDKRHILTTQYLTLSSSLSFIDAKQIKIKPLFATTDSTVKQINISIPNLKIDNVDIKQAYNNKNYKIGSITTSLPKIEINSFIDSAKIQTNKSNFVSTIFDEYFNNLIINRLNIYKGDFNIASKASISQDSLTVEGKINLKLDNFSINKHTFAENIPFKAKNINLQLDNFIIKPSKDIHSFKSSKILINTKDSCIKLSNLNFSANEDSLLLSTLKRLNKNKILDIKIENAEMLKIDLNNALINNKIDTKLISITKPEININIYPQLNILNSTDYDSINEGISNDTIFKNLNFIDKTIAKIIPQQFKLLKIDSVAIDSGIVNLNIKDTLNDKKISTQNSFFINICNFYYNSDSIFSTSKFMFADDYQINLDKFKFRLPDRTHTVKASNIRLSTREQNFYANQLWIGKSQNSKTNPKNVLNLYLPETFIQGIDFQNFANTGFLNIDSCKIDNFVTLILKQNVNNDSTTENKFKINQNFKGLNIKNVSTNGAKFGIMINEKRIVNSDFDFNCNNFSIDSSNIAKTSSIFSFKNPKAKFNMLYVQTPDGANTLKTNYINIDSNNLNIRHLFFETKQKNNINVYVPQINIANSDIEKMVFSKQINAKNISINNPEIELTPTKNAENKIDTTKIENKNQKFSAIIDTIKSNKIKLTIKNNNNKNFNLNNLDLFVSNLNTTINHPTVFPTENITIGLNNYSTTIKDSLYKIETRRIEFLPINQSFKIYDFDFRPTTNRYEFYKQFKYRKSAPYIFCKTIEAEKFNAAELLANHKLEINKLKLNNISFLSYINKIKPYDTTATKPNLHQYIRKIPFNARIDTTYIDNGYIAIEQLSPEASTPGIMTITNVKGRIVNLTNDEQTIRNDSVLKFDGHGKLMDKTNISASFRYTINSPNDEFYCNAHVDSLYLPELNPFLENALFAKINDGILTEADIKFTSDNNYSKGESVFKYHNLKLAVNKRDSVQAKKRGLLSFLANSLIRTDNPKHKFTRTKIGYIYAEPETYKGFSSYWVKSMLSGAKATAGFESKEQKNERRFADKVRDLISKKQRKKNKDKQKKQEIYENEIKENRQKQKTEHKTDLENLNN